MLLTAEVSECPQPVPALEWALRVLGHSPPRLPRNVNRLVDFQQTPDVWKATSFTGGRTWSLADGQPLGRVPKRLLCPNLHAGVPAEQLSVRSADAGESAPGVCHVHLRGRNQGYFCLFCF